MSLITSIIILLVLTVVILFTCLLRDSLTFDFNTFVIKAIGDKIEIPNCDDGEYENKKINELKIDDLKKQKSDFEFLLLSDIHFETSFIHKKKILSIMSHYQDLPIFILGDLISKKRGKNKGLDFLKSLVATNPKRKIIFVRGNHDASIEYNDLISTGVIPLFNESIYLTNNSGDMYQIAGIDDYRIAKSSISESIKKVSEYSDKPLTEIPFSRRILLAHNPDSVFDEASKYFAFIFSGHFHDGQIRLPFRMEFKSLRNDKLAQKNKIYKGFFLNTSTLAYISSGLGTVLLPIRFFTRAEFCRFRIVK